MGELSDPFEERNDMLQRDIVESRTRTQIGKS
jgi:hypothetical protein